MNKLTFYKIAEGTGHASDAGGGSRIPTMTCTTEPPRFVCTACEYNSADVRLTAVCQECRDRARMDRDHNMFSYVMLLLAALGVVFEIGYNMGLGRITQ